MSIRSTGSLRSSSEPDIQPVARWVESLRAACVALLRTPPDVMRAITLVQLATDVPWEAGAITVLSDQLAAEHGLEAAVECDNRHLTIRLSRRGTQGTGER